jgi:hypothetical protein
MASGQERAVFDEHMSTWQAQLDRYQETKDLQLILDPRVITEVRQLPGWATGSATWGDAQHVCAWFHWLRYEALGDGPGDADRQAAEQLFRDQYRTRPADIPQPLRQQWDAQFQQHFAGIMAQVAEETRRRRPNRGALQQLLGALEAICNFTADGDPHYRDRLDARAYVAELARSDLADSYRRDAQQARAQKDHQPPPANPPWRPFNWTMYLAT